MRTVGLMGRDSQEGLWAPLSQGSTGAKLIQEGLDRGWAPSFARGCREEWLPSDLYPQAEKNVWAHRSSLVATRRQSFNLANMFLILWRYR